MVVVLYRGAEKCASAKYHPFGECERNQCLLVFSDGGGHDDGSETVVDDVDKDGLLGLHQLSRQRDDDLV